MRSNPALNTLSTPEPSTMHLTCGRRAVQQSCIRARINRLVSTGAEARLTSGSRPAWVQASPISSQSAVLSAFTLPRLIEASRTPGAGKVHWTCTLAYLTDMRVARRTKKRGRRSERKSDAQSREPRLARRGFGSSRVGRFAVLQQYILPTFLYLRHSRTACEPPCRLPSSPEPSPLPSPSSRNPREEESLPRTTTRTSKLLPPPLAGRPRLQRRG